MNLVLLLQLLVLLQLVNAAFFIDRFIYRALQ